MPYQIYNTSRCEDANLHGSCAVTFVGSLGHILEKKRERAWRTTSTTTVVKRYFSGKPKSIICIR